MAHIAIVGAGIAGLHLALSLQKHGIPVTLYTDRSPEAVRAGRLPSSVALMGTTLDRDTALGTSHWDLRQVGTSFVRLGICGTPVAFRGALDRPFLFVDMRLYVPRLMEDFTARGGTMVVGPTRAEDVDRLASDHELVVVATGRDGLTGLFPRVAARSPYTEPQRRLFAGLFRGIRLPQPFTMGFNIAPGQGEVFENQMWTADGHVAGLLIEAIPGSELDAFTRMRPEEDADAFRAALLGVLEKHAPDTYARTEPSQLALKGPLDWLAGAILPTVRRAWAPLAHGRFALALGDTHITHDPITGQGANAASRAAFLLAGLLIMQLRARRPLDEAFCAHVDERLWEDARSTTEWTNAFLQPPPQHAIALLGAAAQKQRLADAFVSNFNRPEQQWAVVSSPDATASFIARYA